MIFVPPQHGKSLLANEHFPPWYLGRHPERSVAAATYGQDLADDWGRKVRNQMAEPLYAEIFPECELSPDTSAANRLATRQNGNYYAVGIGGPLTGRGVDVLIIDDPHKDRQDADSDTQRKRVREWYQAVAYTRVRKDGAIVIIQTRWHQDDLSGWLLKEHADEGWDVVQFAPDLEKGYAPWPEGFPLGELERKRRALGPREWSALFMQTPTPEGGGEFRRDWLRFYEGAPSAIGGGMNKYLLVDPAGEQRAHNDFTSMWVVGLNSDGCYYWLDGVRDRLDLAQRGQEVMRLHRKWRPLGVRYERYGMMADVQYLRELQNRENYRFEVQEVAGKLKKNDRIRRLLPMFAEGKMYFPHVLHYTDRKGLLHDLVQEFVEQEYAAFPAGLHDDMIDALSRIDEPELPLTWPRQAEDERPKRYARGSQQRVSAWAR